MIPPRDNWNTKGEHICINKRSPVSKFRFHSKSPFWCQFRFYPDFNEGVFQYSTGVLFSVPLSHTYDTHSGGFGTLFSVFGVCPACSISVSHAHNGGTCFAAGPEDRVSRLDPGSCGACQAQTTAGCLRQIFALRLDFWAFPICVTFLLICFFSAYTQSKPCTAFVLHFVQKKKKCGKIADVLSKMLALYPWEKKCKTQNLPQKRTHVLNNYCVFCKNGRK